MESKKTKCFLLGIICAFFNSCAKNLAPDPQAVASGSGNVVIQPLIPGEALLTATRSAASDVYTDGVFSMVTQINIRLPLVIDLTNGSPKNGLAKIIINKDAGENEVECNYIASWDNRSFEFDKCYEGLNREINNSRDYILNSSKEIVLVAHDGDSKAGMLKINASIENQSNNTFIEMNASKSYSQVDSTSTSYSLKYISDFTLPSQIDVLKGNAQEAKAIIIVNKPNHMLNFYCVYEGISTTPGYLNFKECRSDDNSIINWGEGDKIRIPANYQFQLELSKSDANSETVIEHELQLRY